MIYPAIVLDNSMFLSRGTIRVRVSQYYFKEMVWNLSSSPDFIQEGINKDTGSHRDFEAFVFSPIGGGENYGAFFLPQVNSKGLVAFVGNTIERSNVCFWLGSLVSPTYNRTELETLNFPSDKPLANGATSNGFENKTTNLDNTDLNGALIIRLKSTHYDVNETDKTKTQDNLNWEKSNNENFILINKNKIIIHHSSEFDSSQHELTSEDITIDKNNISLKINKTLYSGDTIDASKDKNVYLNLNKDDSNKINFSLIAEDLETKSSNKITSADNSLTLQSTKNNDASIITIEPDNTTIVAKDNTILIDKKGITLNAEKSSVYVVAKDVHLGAEDSHIVTTTYSGYFELPNGMVIRSSDTIFG